MFKQAWRETGSDISMFFEVVDEFDVRKAASLWKAIHAFSDLNHDSIVVEEMGYVVVVDEFLAE